MKLKEMKCVGCEGGIAPLTAAEAQSKKSELHADWVISSDSTAISRRFTFKGFRQSMEFANAIAWVVNREQHHPDLKLGYDYCEVTFTTHAIKGLSTNDFICAAKIDALF